MLDWLRFHGEVVAVDVEGCGSWGAGLPHYLVGQEVDVFEFNRPIRHERQTASEPVKFGRSVEPPTAVVASHFPVN